MAFRFAPDHGTQRESHRRDSLLTADGTAAIIAITRYDDGMTSGSPPHQPGRMTLLEEYVAGRDEPCPRCDYNLRDLRGDVCPECGLPLRLFVGADRVALRRRRQWSLAGLLGFIPLGTALGLSMLFAAFPVAADPIVGALGIVLNILFILLWARAETSGWLRRKTKGERSSLVIVCWLILVLTVASIG